jgi:hypothetical protein
VPVANVHIHLFSGQEDFATTSPHLRPALPLYVFLQSIEMVTVRMLRLGLTVWATKTLQHLALPRW